MREIEAEINEAVKQRNIRVYHGLVLRNAIELNEAKFNGECIEEE